MNFSITFCKVIHGTLRVNFSHSSPQCYSTSYGTRAFCLFLFSHRYVNYSDHKQNSSEDLKIILKVRLVLYFEKCKKTIQHTPIANMLENFHKFPYQKDV